MRVVDHQPRSMAFFDVDQRIEITDVPIHAVEAFGDDKGPLMAAARLRQDCVQRCHVVMREGTALGPGKRGAHDHTVMRKRVVRHQIARSHQRADRGDVGGMSANEAQARLAPIVRREGALQRGMDWPFAGDQATCGG